jgi:hypothetical protein
VARATNGLGALLLIASTGAVCAPIQVTNRPPDPVLVDESGAPDENGFAALAGEIEERRGLRFVRHPTLDLVAGDDSRVRTLAAADCALAPCAREGACEEPASVAAGSCFASADGAGIVCVAPPDLDAARRALRRLLDGQTYPRLVRAAEQLAGDPGIAVRALLAASATGPQPQPSVAVLSERLDVLDLDPIGSEGVEDGSLACTSMGEHFLSVQRDRETAFRRPPLSTKQMLSPRRYRAGEQPVLLAGAPPAQPGCTVARDESVGLARLLTAALAKGRLVRGPVISSWEGDRAVRFACDDGSARWIYVVSVADPAKAAAFAAAAPDLLPAELAEPDETGVAGKRIVLSRGLGGEAPRAWAASLTSEPLTGLPGLD